MFPTPSRFIPTPQPPQYFDYTRASREARLSADQLNALIRIFEKDYPYDVMLRELHVLTACNAIIRGSATVQQVLGSTEERAA